MLISSANLHMHSAWAILFSINLKNTTELLKRLSPPLFFIDTLILCLLLLRIILTSPIQGLLLPAELDLEAFSSEYLLPKHAGFCF